MQDFPQNIIDKIFSQIGADSLKLNLVCRAFHQYKAQHFLNSKLVNGEKNIVPLPTDMIILPNKYALSHDGSKIAVMGQQEGKIYLLLRTKGIEEWKKVYVSAVNAGISRPTFSPDDRHIFILIPSYFNWMKKISLDSWKETLTMIQLPKKLDLFFPLADQFVGTTPNKLIIINLKKNTFKEPTIKDENQVECLGVWFLSPDKTHAVFISKQESGTYYDVIALTEEAVLLTAGHIKAAASKAAFSFDNQEIIFVCGDKPAIAIINRATNAFGVLTIDARDCDSIGFAGPNAIWIREKIANKTRVTLWDRQSENCIGLLTGEYIEVGESASQTTFAVVKDHKMEITSFTHLVPDRRLSKSRSLKQ